MNKEHLFKVGDQKVSRYQRFIIFTGGLLLFLSVMVALLSGNKYYTFFPLIITMLFSTIIYIYTKAYSVQYSSKWFYISNLFTRKKISASDFRELKRVKHFTFLLKIVFKDKSFFLLTESDEYFRNFFKSANNYTKEMTTKIKQNIVN
jgi:hypothetical protein